ncbi:MAG: Ig-like domain-containing protein, partial [Thermoplasmatota archaeon]
DLIPPTVQITKPTKAIYLMDKKIIPFFYPIVLNEITIEVNAYDNDSGIEKVEFYIDGELRETDVSPPYSYLWNDKLTSQHTIEVKAYDNAGNSASEEISVLKGIVKHPWLVLAIVMILYIYYLIQND